MTDEYVERRRAYVNEILLKYNAYEFHGYQAKDVIDIISDNQYYTILQDYVMINEHD